MRRVCVTENQKWFGKQGSLERSVAVSFFEGAAETNDCVSFANNSHWSYPPALCFKLRFICFTWSFIDSLKKNGPKRAILSDIVTVSAC